jgi:hypothetical protein
MAIAGMDDAAGRLSDAVAADRKDADETRRLLYMAIVAPQCKRYNLAGTLINALRHHYSAEDPQLEIKVIRLVNGEMVEGDEKWARGFIKALSVRLGE